MKINYPALWKQLTAHFSLGDCSLHGPDHWRRVEANGLQLSKLNGADETVVRLFAVFHDVERQNDGYDPEHGRRAAELALNIHETAYELASPQLNLLLEACRYHNDGLVSPDLTIGTCWDADRMDLPRVGITPDPEKMSTIHGKDFAERGPIALQRPIGDSKKLSS